MPRYMDDDMSLSDEADEDGALADDDFSAARSVGQDGLASSSAIGRGHPSASALSDSGADDDHGEYDLL